MKECLTGTYFKKNWNEPIGNIIADRESDKDSSIEISYNAHPDYWEMDTFLKL